MEGVGWVVRGKIALNKEWAFLRMKEEISYQLHPTRVLSSPFQEDPSRIAGNASRISSKRRAPNDETETSMLEA